MAVSCTIHKRDGEVEVLRSARPRVVTPPSIPTIAGLVSVADIMTRDVICALGDLPIDAVVDLLVNRHIGCVPVVDGEGCPVGMITKRDLVEWMVRRPSPAEPVPRTAEQAMLPLALTLDERATVAVAAALMAAEDVHHIPIVSPKGRIAGIVSSLDIVRWLARNDAR
ncbi:MAG: CBS domain-containing protein [Deltaproteobacteria bacterium]|nr:CBS domain-containing protein [Deltaproteobacteria bacterium]MCW5806848.1 CBS domain-containing protein [Deltaproteobacteria bacterium]